MRRSVAMLLREETSELQNTMYAYVRLLSTTYDSTHVLQFAGSCML